MAFVHLHTHSEYSLLDGANRIPDLVDRTVELGMDSLAVTDHGNLHAAWHFYEHALARGIRPILGFEAYLAYGDRRSQQKPPDAPAHYSHLVLLARNRIGYRNLIRLSSIGFLEGFYRRPRIDKEVLARHAEGLVCLAACLSGEVAHALRAERYDEARASAAWFAQLFGPDGFWLEIQDHGMAEERVVRQGMLELSRDLGLPIVATNDAHYLRREDAEAHDVLLAIGTGADLDDPKRFRFTGEESYLKSEAEMRQLFGDLPEVLENTARVAALCEFDFEKRYFVPEFPRPEGSASDDELLAELATRGAEARYGTPLPQAVRERLEYELGVIIRAGYAGYFLIVQDFISAARARGIPVGPGRGSAAGSLVAYALRITDVDPLRFDLLFERFLNPERVSMPDIDVDFCFERRGEVIEYVRERYGRDSVGQIVTFGTMKARAAVKDVARVLKIAPGDADRITKLIPSGPAYSLSVNDAVRKVPELAEVVRSAPVYERMARLAGRIEGISRHLSVHAAGVVIAPGPLPEYIPVCTAPTKGAGQTQDGESAIITQFDMNALEKVGMLKMDLLGLKTLTVIHDAVAMVKERHGVEIDVGALSLDDPAVYAMLRQGRTAGVFQFESPLATETLRQMRCDRFDDLVASNALLRPGPLDTGMHLVFIRRKLGHEAVTYPHPALREVLEPTYGVITYQEQVMRIANILAGFSLAEADVLRKAVGKKDAELIRRELGRFVERGVALGHPTSLMEKLAEQIETFGRYGFNKSHSVAYSVLAYQTAWLKAHYPAEFTAALLSSEIGDTDKVVQYINEARELGLEVLPPDVNESGFKFTVVESRRIRFGLGAVRNVGRGAIESILAARQTGRFASLQDLVERIDLRLANKRVLESLIAAGACDSLGGHRAQLTAALDTVLAEAQLLQQDREAGQGSLFGEAPDTARPRRGGLPQVAEWTEAERLAREKELVGFFISGHPLAPFRHEVELFGTRTTATLGQWSNQPVTIGAVVTGIRRQISKKTGKEYARLVLEDFHGTAEAIVFPDAWATLNQTVAEDACLLLTGGYSERDRGEDRAPFVVEGARPLEELRRSGAVAVVVQWALPAAPPGEDLRSIATICAAYPGPAAVYIEWSDGNGESVRLRARALRVSPTEELIQELRSLLGSEQVRLIRAGVTMAIYSLEFEKPLLELERQIEELKRVGAERRVDVADELVGLQTKLERLRGEIYANLTPMQRVSLARHPKRPYALDYLSSIFTDFVELHGDRLYRDDLAIVGGWARLAGQSCMVIGHQKGRDTRENLKRNFGMPHPEGYRKALRLMRLAARFRAPVITLIDTPGAYPGIGAEERGQSEALATNILEMASLPTPIVACVIGEGSSGGALALGVADRVLMLENSVYSVISPEGCAAILWKDASQRERAAEALKLTARDLMEFKLIDEIVPEPVGGAHQDPDAAGEALREALIRHLGELGKLRPDKLVKRRAEKYAAMGVLRRGLMATTVEVRFKGNRKDYFLWPDENEPLRLHDPVIVEAERGLDFGRVGARGDLAAAKCAAGCGGCPVGEGPPAPQRQVVRRATREDIQSANEARRAEDDVRLKAVERARHHGLEIKVSDAEWQWDRKKLTFYFTAEKRVDFRALVRDLASTFRTRIELRQIGVRDEAARLGGVGRCGKEFCCSTWLRELNPVSLSLAKDQRLSLNPAQISGGCGRLLCCLKYEHEFYVAARKRFPKEGKTLRTARGPEKVVAVDIFRERVLLRSEEHGPRQLLLADLRAELESADPSPAAPQGPSPSTEPRPTPGPVATQPADPTPTPRSARKRPRRRRRRGPRGPGGPTPPRPES